MNESGMRFVGVEPWKILLAVLIACVATRSVDAQEEYRTWTSANGKFRIEAKYLRTQDSKVRLLRKDNGKQIIVPIGKLSPPDQQFLKKANTVDWGKWITKDGRCKHKLLDGVLQMSLPGGKFVMHAAEGNLSAPRMELIVDKEQFILEVTVDGDFQPKSGGKNEYRAAGLYSFADDENYLRLERAFYSGNHYVNFEKVEHGRLFQGGQFNESKIDPSKPVTLRLIVSDYEAIAGYKQGKNEFTYLGRTEMWEPIMLVDDPPDDDVVKQRVGVAAHSTSSSPFKPTFRGWNRVVKQASVESAARASRR